MCSVRSTAAVYRYSACHCTKGYRLAPKTLHLDWALMGAASGVYIKKEGTLADPLLLVVGHIITPEKLLSGPCRTEGWIGHQAIT